MGYTTEFDGEFELSRDLTIREYNLLKGLCGERFGDSMGRTKPGYPGLYCQWEPDEDGTHIKWDGGEKFYDYVPWMNYIIEKYLTPWGITVTGKVHYQGEGTGDHGNLVIKDGKCVQVPDADIGDMAERLETYIEELNAVPDDCRLIPIGQVTDRLTAILYGDKA